MAISVTELRANIYKLLDRVIATGLPLEIRRKGKIVRLVPERTRSKLDNLVSHPDAFDGDPEEFVHMDWSSEWKP